MSALTGTTTIATPTTVAHAISRAATYIKKVYLPAYTYARVAKMVIGHCYAHRPVQVNGRDVDLDFRDVCGIAVKYDSDMNEEARDGEWNYLQYYCSVYERDWEAALQIENALMGFGVQCKQKVPPDKYEPGSALLVCYDVYLK